MFSFLGALPPSMLGVADTVDAKPIIVQAWRAEYGIDPTPTETQAVLAIARHETGYGEGWHGFMKGSHNYGAIQCSTRPDESQPPESACPPGCALNDDKHPGGQTYSACFKTYPSDLEGARGLVRRLNAGGIKAALATGDMLTIAQAMRKTFYFEGRCEAGDPGGMQCGEDVRVRHYADALFQNGKELAAKLGEPFLLTLPGEGGEGVAGGGLTAGVALLGGGLLGLLLLGLSKKFRSPK